MVGIHNLRRRRNRWAVGESPPVLSIRFDLVYAAVKYTTKESINIGQLRNALRDAANVWEGDDHFWDTGVFGWPPQILVEERPVNVTEDTLQDHLDNGQGGTVLCPCFFIDEDYFTLVGETGVMDIPNSDAIEITSCLHEIGDYKLYDAVCETTKHYAWYGFRALEDTPFGRFCYENVLNVGLLTEPNDEIDFSVFYPSSIAKLINRPPRDYTHLTLDFRNLDGDNWDWPDPMSEEDDDLPSEEGTEPGPPRQGFDSHPRGDAD